MSIIPFHFQGEDKEQGDSKSIGDQNNDDKRSEVSNEEGTKFDFTRSSKEMTVSRKCLQGKDSAFIISLQGHSVEFEVLWKEVNNR